MNVSLSRVVDHETLTNHRDCDILSSHNGRGRESWIDVDDYDARTGLNDFSNTRSRAQVDAEVD